MNDQAHQKWLSWIYPLPSPLKSAEDAERFNHQDLVGMTESGKRRERERLRLRLLLDDCPDVWFLGRLKKLETQIHEPR